MEELKLIFNSSGIQPTPYKKVSRIAKTRKDFLGIKPKASPRLFGKEISDEKLPSRLASH